MPGESGAFDRQQRPCVPQKPVAQIPCCSLQPAQQFSLAFIRVGWSGGGLGGDGGWLGGSGEHRATVVRVVSTLACHPPTGEVLLLLLSSGTSSSVLKIVAKSVVSHKQRVERVEKPPLSAVSSGSRDGKAKMVGRSGWHDTPHMAP